MGAQKAKQSRGRLHFSTLNENRLSERSQRLRHRRCTSFGVGPMSGNAQLAKSLFYESTASSAEPATPKAATYPNFHGAFNAPPERKWQIEVQSRLLKYVAKRLG